MLGSRVRIQVPMNLFPMGTLILKKEPVSTQEASLCIPFTRWSSISLLRC